MHIPVPSASIFWQQHCVTTRLGITCQTHGSAVSEDRNWRDLVWGHAKWILHHHMGSMLYWKRCKIASPHLRFLFSEKLNIVEEKKNQPYSKKFSWCRILENTTFLFNWYIAQRAIVFTIAIYQTISCVIFGLNYEHLKGPIHVRLFFTHTCETTMMIWLEIVHPRGFCSCCWGLFCVFKKA